MQFYNSASVAVAFELIADAQACSVRNLYSVLNEVCLQLRRDFRVVSEVPRQLPSPRDTLPRGEREMGGLLLQGSRRLAITLPSI